MATAMEVRDTEVVAKAKRRRLSAEKRYVAREIFGYLRLRAVEVVPGAP